MNQDKATQIRELLAALELHTRFPDTPERKAVREFLMSVQSDVGAILAEPDPPDTRDLAGMREIVAMLERQVEHEEAALATEKGMDRVPRHGGIESLEHVLPLARDILARHAAGSPRGVWVELTEELAEAYAAISSATKAHMRQGRRHDRPGLPINPVPALAFAVWQAMDAQYPKAGEVGT